MKRYWVSWYSSYCLECDHKNYPVQTWETGSRADDSLDCKHGFPFSSFCAVIDTDKREDEIFNELRKYTPDLEPRFCQDVEPDFQPNSGRFPGFESRTRLEEQNISEEAAIEINEKYAVVLGDDIVLL